jgi:hypothetical protein
MRMQQFFDSRMFARLCGGAIACVGLAFFASGSVAFAQTPAPANVSPDVREIVRLANAKMTDDVIVAYIKNSGKTYNLSADDILYLNSQGVSQPVISTLLQARGAGGAPPGPAPVEPPVVAPQTPPPQIPGPPPAVAPGPIPETPTLSYFQGELAPYGRWVTVPDVGPAWIPNAASADPTWRPYLNEGHWTFTDAGWFWQSDYPWGDVAFHYGRWLKDARTGWAWAWVPGYHWAPSWVCWRYDQADGVCGWAPLPPGARFDVGVGLTFHGVPAVDVDFGLRFDDFAFVGFDHLWDPHLHGFLFEPERARFFFGHSFIRNGYRFDHGVFRIDGIGRERIGVFTHRDVRIAEAHDLRRVEERDHAIHRADEHARGRADEHREGERRGEERRDDHR